MSKGQVIKIKDYTIQLPDVPDKSKILFVNEKKENQYWRRQTHSRFFHDFNPRITKAFANETFYDNHTGDLLALNEADSLIVQRELQIENHRRKYGVYAMINGVLTYIAPDYYYNLQWFQMKDLPEKYGRYRKIQNELFIVCQWAKSQPWITVVMVPKCKKSGVTQVFAGATVNEGTQNEGWELGWVSKEFDHVKDVAMSYIFHGFDNLPMILQPTVKKRNLHELVFGRPVDGVKANSVKSSGAFLNTRIFAAKTKTTCFDGPVIRRGFADEFPKMWEASHISPDTAHKKMIETVKLQQKKNGLLFYFSYLPEKDDKGYFEFADLCKKSRMSMRDEVTGQTPTGGIVFPIYATESNEQEFDLYGECNQTRAYKRVKDEYNSKTSKSDKQAHRRQYPTNWSDMFDAGGQGVTFNTIQIGMRKAELEPEILTGILPYRIGHLRFANSIWESGDKENRRRPGKFCEVYFEELTDEQKMDENEGSIKLFQDVPKDFLNQPYLKDSRSIEDGELEPLEDYERVASFDPTDYRLASDVAVGSRNAGHGGFIFNPSLHNKGVKTDELWFEYFFRHEDPDDTLDDVVKIILYTGCRIVIEANKGWLVTRIKKEGLHHFLLLKDTDGTIRPYQEGDEQDLVDTTAKMIEAYCRAINRYWASPKKDGQEIMSPKLAAIKSLKLLEQHLEFDPTNPQKFDLVVSFGYWRLAVESFSAFLDEERNDENYDAETMRHAFNSLV